VSFSVTDLTIVSSVTGEMTFGLSIVPKYDISTSGGVPISASEQVGEPGDVDKPGTLSDDKLRSDTG